MRIGLDVDDVLFPWTDLAHKACEERGITNGKSVTQWKAYLDYGCTSEEFWAVVNTEYDFGMLTRGFPYEGIGSALDGLHAAGHTIHLVTARGFEGVRARMIRSDTARWLASHVIPFDSLTFSQNKAEVALGIGLDVFLDDSIPNTASVRAVGVDAYLHDQPHNRSDTTLPRVDNLHHFIESVVNKKEGH